MYGEVKERISVFDKLVFFFLVISEYFTINLLSLKKKKKNPPK